MDGMKEWHSEKMASTKRVTLTKKRSIISLIRYCPNNFLKKPVNMVNF